MTAILSDRCMHGHFFNAENTRRRMRNGGILRICRKCDAMRMRRRYQNDTEFRERKKTQERQRYHDNASRTRLPIVRNSFSNPYIWGWHRYLWWEGVRRGVQL